MFKLATSDVMSAEKQDALCDFILNKLEHCADMAEIAPYLTL